MLDILNNLNVVPAVIGGIVSILVPVGMGIMGLLAVYASKRK